MANWTRFLPLRSCFVKGKWKWSRSVVSDSATLWTVVHQAPPSIRFSRQEYWSGLPFPSPGDLPYPGIEPRSPALQADALTSEPLGKPLYSLIKSKTSIIWMVSPRLSQDVDPIQVPPKIPAPSSDLLVLLNLCARGYVCSKTVLKSKTVFHIWQPGNAAI